MMFGKSEFSFSKFLIKEMSKNDALLIPKHTLSKQLLQQNINLVWQKLLQKFKQPFYLSNQVAVKPLLYHHTKTISFIQ